LKYEREYDKNIRRLNVIRVKHEIIDYTPTLIMISPVTIHDLSASQIALWMKAQQAVQAKNYRYAISIVKTLINKAPGFLEGRKLLRACSVKENGNSPRKSSLFGGIRLTTTRKSPEITIVAIEDELEKDPYSIASNETLFAAAVELGLNDTASFALETICEGYPKVKKHLHLLAKHYIKNEKFLEATSAYSKILEIDRADPIAMKAEKDCAARASIQQGNWEGKGDFRTKMNKKQETNVLDAEIKIGQTREEMEEQLALLSAEYALDNNNLKIVRGIAAVYEQMDDFANAYSFYSYAFDLGGNTDLSLKDKAMEAREKALQAEIAYYRQVVAADPSNQEAVDYLAVKEKEISETIVTDARARVEANPTDAQLQFKLGEALYMADAFTEAIPALQRARNNPNLRIKAMIMLGRCYGSKNMLDMAIRQLEEAEKELLVMDETKKELLYLMGSLLEQTGDKEKAILKLKSIYEVDYGYKDVAQKVESAYS